MDDKEKALYQVFRYIEIFISKVKDLQISDTVTVEAKALLIRTLKDLESDFNCLWLYDIFPQAEIDNIRVFAELERTWNIIKFEFNKYKLFLSETT